MDKYDVYKDIKKRTGGEIYIGVVGPVRSGKSTFIKQFMEKLVIPGIQSEEEKRQAVDEMPQSATGNMIMTTEPKFVPKEAASITIGDGTDIKVRLIDCVGFITEGAKGYIEDDKERMVKTPWTKDRIPFSKAAEMGTKKVINDHSTVGIVVTSDGSFGNITRNAYKEAEKLAVNELNNIGKPYIILLNSSKPFSQSTIETAKEMTDMYGVKVLPVNIEELTEEDIKNIINGILMEFKINRVDYYMPTWIDMLDNNHPVKQEIICKVKETLAGISTLNDAEKLLHNINGQYISDVNLKGINPGEGIVSVDISFDESNYYNVLKEITGLDINDEYMLINCLKRYAESKKETALLMDAYEQVKMTGYGVVLQSANNTNLCEPEIIRHGNKYGVRIKAITPSIHMINANIETEIAPIVGTKEQAEALLDYMLSNKEDSENGIWETNIFGKSVKELVDDGINNKVNKLTRESEEKLQEAIGKVINDSNGGLICIII